MQFGKFSRKQCVLFLLLHIVHEQLVKYGANQSLQHLVTVHVYTRVCVQMGRYCHALLKSQGHTHKHSDRGIACMLITF